MKVQVIAQTQVMADASDILSMELGVTDADYLAEFAARDCYQSQHRPNPATADNRPHLLRDIEHGHFSILEHASVTFRVTEVSRTLSHELVRHRHFSYSQLSQRFVDSKRAKPVIPPIVDCWPDLVQRADMIESLQRTWVNSVMEYERITGILYAGIPEHFPTFDGTLRRKRAREAARAWLPNAAETLLDVTGNHRALREFIQKRADCAADLEIMMLAREMLRKLLTIAPSTYQDMTGLL